MYSFKFVNGFMDRAQVKEREEAGRQMKAGQEETPIVRQNDGKPA